MVFIKDVWRTDMPEADTEGAVLEELLEAGVRNIPAVVCHGDVLYESKATFPTSVGFEVSPHEMKLLTKPRKPIGSQKRTGWGADTQRTQNTALFHVSATGWSPSTRASGSQLLRGRENY